LAQFAERGVQAVVKIDEGVSRPKALAQVVSAHQSARLFQEARQNIKWFPLKMNSSAVLAQFACFQTNFKRAESILRRISTLKGHYLPNPSCSF
jgi:hypothetical protein